MKKKQQQQQQCARLGCRHGFVPNPNHWLFLLFVCMMQIENAVALPVSFVLTVDNKHDAPPSSSSSSSSGLLSQQQHQQQRRRKQVSVQRRQEQPQHHADNDNNNNEASPPPGTKQKYRNRANPHVCHEGSRVGYFKPCRSEESDMDDFMDMPGMRNRFSFSMFLGLDPHKQSMSQYMTFYMTHLFNQTLDNVQMVMDDAYVDNMAHSMPGGMMGGMMDSVTEVQHSFESHGGMAMMGTEEEDDDEEGAEEEEDVFGDDSNDVPSEGEGESTRDDNNSNSNNHQLRRRRQLQGVYDDGMFKLFHLSTDTKLHMKGQHVWVWRYEMHYAAYHANDMAPADNLQMTEIHQNMSFAAQQMKDDMQDSLQGMMTSDGDGDGGNNGNNDDDDDDDETGGTSGGGMMMMFVGFEQDEDAMMEEMANQTRTGGRGGGGTGGQKTTTASQTLGLLPLKYWDWQRYAGLALLVVTVVTTAVVTSLSVSRHTFQQAQHAWGNLAHERGVSELLETGWILKGNQLHVFDKSGMGYSDECSLFEGGFEQRESVIGHEIHISQQEEPLPPLQKKKKQQQQLQQSFAQP